MKRRALLAATSWTAAALAGCPSFKRESAETSTPAPTEPPTKSPTEGDTTAKPEETPDNDPEVDSVWRYDFGGWVDGFAGGKVYCREHWIGDEAEGRVVGLDVETGERQWDFGIADGLSAYSELLVEDAVYFGRRDDVVNGGDGEVYALEHDGSERWTYPETTSLDRRPLLHENVLYAAGDAGKVRAFDPADGTVLWENDDLPNARTMDNGVIQVRDVVLVKMGQLFGLDPDDGTVQWSYGDEDSRWGLEVTVTAEGVYVNQHDGGIAAVRRDGTEKWHRDDEAVLRTVCNGRAILDTDGAVSTLYGLEVATGERRWSISDFEFSVKACHGGRLYATERDGNVLRTFDPVDGTELRRTPVGESPTRRVWSTGGDGAVYVETEADALHRVTNGGEVTASHYFEESIVSVRVRDDVYVGTIEGIYRLPVE